MNPDDRPEFVAALQDRGAALLDVLLIVMYVAGVAGIVLSLYLLIASSPKDPRR